MHLCYRDFVILVRDSHGLPRAIVLDPQTPYAYHKLTGPDVDHAAEAAKRYVDQVIAGRVLRPTGTGPTFLA